MTEESGRGKKVVGLAYDQGQGLPRIVLKGVGPVAERIESDFESLNDSYWIVEDADLLDRLFRLPTDSEISPDLYELVAILLVHVYAIESKLKGQHD